MKRISTILAIASTVALLITTAVFALVSNGDFETGDFTGWTKSAFINNNFSAPHGSGGSDLSVIVGGPAVAPLSLSDPNTNGALKYPAYGHYSARVNSELSYSSGGYGQNGNTISRTITAVLDPADNLAHVRFTYAAVMVNPNHDPEEQPYFRVRVINVSNGNDVVYDFASYVGEPGKNWQNGASSWQYLDWSYIDLASSAAHPVNAGHTLTLEVTAAGCSPSGHPGYAYVDEATDTQIAGPYVQASGPATTSSGASITYTYTYANGSADPVNPTITATQPTGVTFTSVSDTTNCSLSSGTVTCNFTGLSAGANGSFTITGTVTAPGNAQIAHGGYQIAAPGFPTIGGKTVLTDVNEVAVTINQAGGQGDPTSSSPVLFTVTFGSPVTGFTGTDVTLSASTTGGSLTALVTETGPMNGTTYQVAVSGMTTPGNVIATLAANVVNGGNTASTSSDNTVFYDGTPPDTTITSNPAFQTASTNASFGFTGDDGSGTGLAGLERQLDSGVITACTSLRSYSSLSEGIHTFLVRAIDNVGNADPTPAIYTWLVDLTPPAITITVNPPVQTPSTNASFGFTGNDGSGSGVAGFECQLDAGAYTPCINPQNYSGLSEGIHTFRVRSTDNVSNLNSAPTTYSWTVDYTPPETTITGTPSDPSNLFNPILSFTGLDNLTPTPSLAYQCQLDGGGFGPCTGSIGYNNLTPGSHTFEVRAIDLAGNVDPTPATYTWYVCPVVTIEPAAPAQAFKRIPYSQQLTAVGSNGPTTFTFTGTLPPGLALSSTGLLAGTPTQTGTFNFTVIVTGPGGCTVSRNYQFSVICPVLTFDPASLPGGQVGTAYNQTISAGPSGTTFSYAVTSGNLPVGLTLNGATGVISGVLGAGGSYDFVITATGFEGCTSARPYQIIVTTTCSALTIGPATLPNGSLGTAYNQLLAATGDPGPYTFAVTQGMLPAGLTLNASTGALTGTPTQAGLFPFRITATAQGGCTTSQNYAVTVSCGALGFAPSTLPDGEAGMSYPPQQLTVTPAGNYTFTLLTGQLPPGFTLGAQSGIISGISNVPGYYTFTLKVIGVNACTSTVQYSIRIVCPTITVTPDTLPAGSVNTPYFQTFYSLPQTQPGVFYTCSVVEGALPPGLTLNTGTGELTGLPTAVGTYTFTIQATGFTSCTGANSYTLVIGSSRAALAQSADYNGDGQADPVLWAADTGTWRIRRSGTQQLQSTVWGQAGDIPLLGDYDGDGKSDLAVFRPSDAAFYIKYSRNGGVLVKQWGLSTDVPTPGDYDGDGKTDIAVWRGSNGTWYIVYSSTGLIETIAWGAKEAPYYDVPVASDYDGDGKTDLAVFRRASGFWFIKRSSDGQYASKIWGLGTDTPVPNDYDGDGKADLAVWRGGVWYISQSTSTRYRVIEWGAQAAPYYDQAVPDDYDGDGQADLAVWRQSDGTWYVICSRDGSVRTTVSGQGMGVPVSPHLR